MRCDAMRRYWEEDDVMMQRRYIDMHDGTEVDLSGRGEGRRR